jgi:hypothetical protein
MKSLVGIDMPYALGTGDYSTAVATGGPDVPWTRRAKDGLVGADCAGVAMSWASQIPRHRPGLNHGSWATVSDDLNTNSGIEDAEHEGDLYTVVHGDDVFPGDLLCYKTIQLRTPDGTDWIRNEDGSIKKWIGHVQMIEVVPVGWKRSDGWTALTVLQCCGGDGRRPAVIRSDAHAMDMHDHVWPKQEHRVHVLRVKP